MKKCLLRSELYRQQVCGIEVLTYDELFERARL